MALPTSNQLVSMRVMRELVAAGHLGWWAQGSAPGSLLDENRVLTWDDLMFYTSNRDSPGSLLRRLPSWRDVEGWKNEPQDWAEITDVDWFWTGNQNGFGYAATWSAGSLVGVSDWVYRHSNMQSPAVTGGAVGGSYSTSYGMPEDSTVTFTIYPRRHRTRGGIPETLHGRTKTLTLTVPLQPPGSPNYNPAASRVEFLDTGTRRNRATLEESRDDGATWSVIYDTPLGTEYGRTLYVERGIQPGDTRRWRARLHRMDGATELNASPFSASAPYTVPPKHPTEIYVHRVAERSFAVSSNGGFGSHSGYRFRWERQDNQPGYPIVEFPYTADGFFNSTQEGTGPAPILGHYYHYRARMEATDGSMIGAWSPWSAPAGPA